TATLLLLIAVGLRVFPPKPEKPHDAEVESTISVESAVPSAARWRDLPYGGHIVADHIRPGGNGHERSVTWNVPTRVVAPLLYKLELTAATRRYDARRDEEGWTVTAALGVADGDSGDSSPDGFRKPSLPREEWTTAIETVLATAAPPTDAGDASAAPNGLRTGGSGYVRIESRGRMNWLWDAEVLRLEPAR
nr:hypothetical protein [Spirochaeta sp.]